MIHAKASGGKILWQVRDFASTSDWQKLEADAFSFAQCTQKENIFAEIGIKLSLFYK